MIQPQGGISRCTALRQALMTADIAPTQRLCASRAWSRLGLTVMNARATVSLAGLCLVLWGAAVRAHEGKQQGDPAVIRSPNGLIAIEVSTHAVSGTAGQLQYRVTVADRPAVLASNLGVRLKGGGQLGRNSVI